MKDGDEITWGEMRRLGYSLGALTVKIQADGTTVLMRPLLDPQGNPVVIHHARLNTRGIITGLTISEGAEP